ncbi:hypothetical protein C3F00_036930 [Pseudomonas sp. MWU13-2860]|nr:hypothetical protein C3F00_036930 [Pseudomonas sp. MWU13-2860]
MLKTFIRLLGEDAVKWRRYAWLALIYSLLCGVTIVMLAPVLSHLLAGEARAREVLSYVAPVGEERDYVERALSLVSTPEAALS